MGKRRRINIRDHNHKWYVYVLPTDVYLGGALGDGIKRVLKPLLTLIQPLRFSSYSQRVFSSIVIEAAPLIRRSVEDDCPVVLVRYGVQAVSHLITCRT